jgi:hypothetical protein
MKLSSRLTLVALAAGVFATTPALAQEHWRHREFVERHWHEGRWVHGWHGGRQGWWWVIGPSWFFYPAPIYPRPQPPVVVVTPPPPAQVPTGYYYYCPNPPGYYPTVAQCAVGWQLVPPAPAAGTPPVVVPAPQPVPPAPALPPG